jgi:hypothetical protein
VCRCRTTASTTIAVLGAVGPGQGARRLERLAALARAARLPSASCLIGYMDVEKAPGKATMRCSPCTAATSRATARLLAQYRVRLVAFPSAGPEPSASRCPRHGPRGCRDRSSVRRARRACCRHECRLVVDGRRMARRSQMLARMVELVAAGTRGALAAAGANGKA